MEYKSIIEISQIVNFNFLHTYMNYCMKLHI